MMKKMRKGIYLVFGLILAVALINSMMQTDTDIQSDTTKTTAFSAVTDGAHATNTGDTTAVTARVTTAPTLERFPNLPQAYRNCVYVDSRMYGGCMTLTGNVHITVVFANDDTAKWTTAAKEREKEKYQAAADIVKKAAKAYGKTVNFEFSYLNATASGTPTINDNDGWMESALKSAGLPDRSRLNDTLEQQYGAKEAPVIFAVNHTGRAYATPNGGGEHIVLHATDEAFCHELYHLFGAEDFYFPDEVEQVARDTFGKSVMLDSGEQTVDSLTAYLVGWTDKPDKKALAFLEKTKHITAEILSEELKKETYTGYVKNRDMGTYTFTGNLKDGSPVDGECVYVYDSGAKYDGYVQGGQFHGKGVYRWANGDTYDGDWVHGERTGKGTYVWKDGGKYVGDWVDNERTGQGTYTLSDGGKYTGGFEGGKYHGQGTMKWSDGGKYVGSWVNGVREGQGTLTYASGGKYTGSFSDNELHGEGTFQWSNGDKYVGGWKHGKQDGAGTYYWANGGSKSGQWKDGVYVG